LPAFQTGFGLPLPSRFVALFVPGELDLFLGRTVGRGPFGIAQFRLDQFLRLGGGSFGNQPRILETIEIEHNVGAVPLVRHMDIDHVVR
jgi:hypothetical protein